MRSSLASPEPICQKSWLNYEEVFMTTWTLRENYVRLTTFVRQRFRVIAYPVRSSAQMSSASPTIINQRTGLSPHLLAARQVTCSYYILALTPPLVSSREGLKDNHIDTLLSDSLFQALYSLSHNFNLILVLKNSILHRHMSHETARPSYRSELGVFFLAT